MKKIYEFIKGGKLSEAMEYCTSLLKDEPLNFDIRSAYAELLCIDGDLDRADKQLDFMVKKNPEFAVGAINLRHLIRAEQSRQDFYSGKSAPKLFHEADELDTLFLEMHLAKLEGDSDLLVDMSSKLEVLRAASFSDDHPQSMVRDLDDILNPYLEVLGTNGEFYLARFSEIESLKVEPVDSLLENIWLRVEMGIKDGPSGTAHLPLVYAQSENDVEKLGQITEWDELSENVVVGRGMKMLFINEEASLISDLSISKNKELSVD
ncbi:type VI secretion system accessory protein TagJ [Marinomonas lutimaris]|uniref:type VI secretion system accessory protein TagJ n=1 Tax=Marinomonas lutimaris TaxID=2846746 RepID=UPI001CA55E56|nr:type VI secretion system accessory protein TagJ [Marinomonas lutimaris]